MIMIENLLIKNLSQVTPEQICSYMKLRAYGNANADIATDNPTVSRSSSLEFWKKAISYCMPNNNMTHILCQIII